MTAIATPATGSKTHHKVTQTVHWSVHFDGPPENRPRMKRPNNPEDRPFVVERIHGRVTGGANLTVATVQGRYVRNDGTLYDGSSWFEVYQSAIPEDMPHVAIEAMADAIRRHGILTQMVAAQGWSE